MLDEKFILEHIDELTQLRDFDEVYEYFTSQGISINVDEIFALKDSHNLLNNLEAHSQALTMQQLDCVAGGMSGTMIGVSAGAGLGYLIGSFIPIPGASIALVSCGALIGSLIGTAVENMGDKGSNDPNPNPTPDSGHTD